MKLRITIFGLAITSSWGNGHATTFRALCNALYKRGHRISFFEKDVEWYASNRDLPDPPYADVHLYSAWSEALPRIRKQLRECDVAVVGSYFPDGIAALRELLDAKVPIKSFYDIDTPVTLAALRQGNACDYLSKELLPELDLYFSFTGGPVLRELEETFGVRRALPLYCSFDPQTYLRTAADSRLRCLLSYMGTFARDRQPKLDELLCAPARRLPEMRFIVAGSMYPDTVKWPANVEHITHLEPQYHARLYSSSDFVLNVTRREMVMAGYSPSVRLFEAAACGATIISDPWPGLESFFTPGEEILLASSSSDMLDVLRTGPIPAVGARAQERVLQHHTSATRAAEFERAVESVGASATASA